MAVGGTVQDVALNFGGQISYRKFTFTYLDLQTTTGAGAKAFTLPEVGSPGPSGTPPTFKFPAGAKVLGVFVKHSVSFAGGALNAMTISLGISGGSTTFFTGTFDIFQAVADTTVQETALFKMGQLSALTPAVNFVPTGDNASAATAGSVDVWVAYLNVTGP